MAQITSGLRRVLAAGWVYDGFQRLIGARGLYRRLLGEFARPVAGERLLDIGCGPAAILAELDPAVEYYGFDDSAAYIARAERRFGGRGHFWAERVGQARLAGVPPFDLALAVGVLHHLDDDEARALFALARGALGPRGRLVTYDACFTETQSRAARYLVARDRGQNIRRPEGYRALALASFPEVTATVLEGHLRLPYTSVVLVCRSAAGSPA